MSEVKNKYQFEKAKNEEGRLRYKIKSAICAAFMGISYFNSSGGVDHHNKFVSEVYNPKQPVSFQIENSLIFGKVKDHDIDHRQLPNFLENEDFYREYKTPASLMLHGADLPQVKELMPKIVEQGYQTITYSNYLELINSGDEIPDNLLLISIDDLNPLLLNNYFKGIIETMLENNMVGTIAIVTSGERSEAKEEIWDYYKKLSDAGWELAIHSEDHLNLPLLSDQNLRHQIEEPYNEILEKTGIAPVSLILPFGRGEEDPRIQEICTELNIKFIVGIAGGKEFSGTPPFYVGRIAPGNSAEQTITYLENSFEKP
jgi:hypothetical protein